jgi:hypothetical protein
MRYQRESMTTRIGATFRCNSPRFLFAVCVTSLVLQPTSESEASKFVKLTFIEKGYAQTEPW